MIANEKYNSNFNYNDSLEIELAKKLNTYYKEKDIHFEKIPTNNRKTFYDLLIRHKKKIEKAEVKNLQQFTKFGDISIEITDHRGNLFNTDSSNVWINTEQDNKYLLYNIIENGEIKEVYIYNFIEFRKYIISILEKIFNLYYKDGDIHNVFLDNNLKICTKNSVYKVLKNKDDGKFNLYINKDNPQLQKYIVKHIKF